MHNHDHARLPISVTGDMCDGLSGATRLRAGTPLSSKMAFGRCSSLVVNDIEGQEKLIIGMPRRGAWISRCLRMDLS